MNKLLIVLGIAATVAAVVFAAGSTIQIIECKDLMCKESCRVVAKTSADKCNTRRWSHRGSFDAKCLPAPHAMCVYHAAYHRNGTTPTEVCSEKNIMSLGYQQCGRCHLPFQGRNHHNHTHPMYAMIDCGSGSNMTLKYGCDSTCSTCAHTHSVKEKTCVMPAHHFTEYAFAWSAPAKCNPLILSSHWANSTTCDGAPSMVDRVYENTCYARAGRKHGAHGSHMYKCS